MTGPATLPQVRTALASQLASKISGLRATGTIPGNPLPPTAIVGPAPGTMMSYQTFSAPGFPGSIEWYLRVMLLVGAGDDPDAQALLDGYLSVDGASSVTQAIYADPTLGGVADYAEPTSSTGYGLITYGAIQYLGSHVLVTVGCS